MIGEAVLSRMELKAKELGWKVVRKPCKAVFKFGNAGSLTSEEAAIIPCMIGGRKLLLKASVLPGSGAGTPLLFSKELLKKLGAVINTTNDSLICETLGVTVKMRTTSKGHYALPLFDVEQVGAHTYTHHDVHMTATLDQEREGRIFKSRARQAAGDHGEPCGGDVAQSQQSSSLPGVGTCGGGQSSGSDQSQHGSGLRHVSGRNGRFPPSGRAERISSDERGQAQATSRKSGLEHGTDLSPGQELCEVGEESYQSRQWKDDEATQAVHRDARSSEGSQDGSGREWRNDSASISVTGSRITSSTDDTSNQRSGVSRTDGASDSSTLCSKSALIVPHTTMQQLVEGDDSSGDTQDELQEISERRRHGDSGDAVRSGSKVASHDSGSNSGCRGEEANLRLQCGSPHGEGGRCEAGSSDDGLSDELRGSRVGQIKRSQCRSDDFRTNAVNQVKFESGQEDHEIKDWSGEDGCHGTSMNRKTRRKLRKAIEDIESYGCFEAWSESLDKRKADVCEVFSVPRINQHAHGRFGLTSGKNYDLVLGDDLLQFSHRKRVREEIEKDDPFCVVLCPPCTMFSQMRRIFGDTEDEKRKLREAIVLLNFAIEICEDRRKRGRYFLFEHPQGAKSWSCKRMQRLLEQPNVSEVVLDMCQYGMCDRVNGKPHRKSTRLLGNLQEDVMLGLHRRCNGEHEHQPLEGRVCVGGKWHNRTRLAQEYPDEFCRAVCKAISKQKKLVNDNVVVDDFEIHAVEGLKEDDDKKLCETIRRAHQNLGHPGTERFVEMLRVAGASQKALEHAKRYKCSICEAQQGSKVQKVSKVRKTYEFNVGVCCDTFELEIGNRKIHGFSVICEGTNYHVVVPLWKGKTAEETRRAYRRCWKSPFGAPVRLFTDGGSEFSGALSRRVVSGWNG